MKNKNRLLIALACWLLPVGSVYAAVEFINAYVATPIPGTKITSAYGELHNTGDDDVLITHITSDSSQAAELHEQKIDGADIARMRPVEALTVPAHGSLILQKGGKHLMLINLQKKLHDHDKVVITLYFEHGGQQQVTLPVLRSAAQLPTNEQ